MPDQKEVTDLIKHIRAAGYVVAKSGNAKHYKVMKKGGGAVIDDNGPLIISSSPSETRFREMTVKRLMGAGVLKADPYKATGGANGQRQQKPPSAAKAAARRASAELLRSPEVRAKKLAAIQARSRAFRERTVAVRARVEPIAAKLGGWREGGHAEHGITTTEFGQVALHWGTARGLVEVPRPRPPATEFTPSTLSSAMSNLRRKDGTLGDKWIGFIEMFVDELERKAGSPPKPELAAARYRELLRELKGIPLERKRGLAPIEPGELAEPGAHQQTSEPVGPRYTPLVPSLALEAVYLMAHAANGDGPGMEKVLDVGERIAKLEMGLPVSAPQATERSKR